MKKTEAEVIQAIWNDPEEHQAFLANPKKYLLEQGQEIPKDTEVKAYEDTPSLRHFLLPSKGTQLPGEDEPFLQIAKRAMEDSEFKAELLKNPRTVAQEMGIAIPDGLEIKILDNKPDEINVIVPFNSASGELSDADLEAVAGGKGTPAICAGVGGVLAAGCVAAGFFTGGVTAIASLVGGGGVAAGSAAGS